MYSVRKISVTTRHADGSAVYDYELTYGTWRELLSDLAQREQYANEIFMGRGALVFDGDDELLGNVRDFGSLDLDGIPIRQTTRAAFVSADE